MRRRRLSRRTVHPRLRGDLGRPHYHAILFNGSSPLTRGTPLQNTLPRKFPAVHPRLRGELGTEYTGIGLEVGSSPLTRGTQVN